MIASSLATALVETTKAITGFEVVWTMLSTSLAIACRPPKLKLLCWNTVNQNLNKKWLYIADIPQTK